MRWSPADAVVLGVVDPGVGTPRRPVALRLGDRWLVGPDNGLFAPAVRQARSDGVPVEAWTVAWRPAVLSASFHGRDLFAPVAAALARGDLPPGRPTDPESLVGVREGPDDLPAVVYVDGYGNAMTGLRAETLPAGSRIAVAGRHLDQAETFGAVPVGAPFWYANSSGLVELAVNQGSAARLLSLGIGAPVTLVIGGAPQPVPVDEV